MITKKRYDGTYIRNLHFLVQIMPYIMPTRKDACIYFEQDFDVTKTLEYVRNKKNDETSVFGGGGIKITPFYVILYSALRTIALRPKLNRFVSGHRFYQRNRILFNFMAKRELTDDGEEVSVTMSFSPLLSLEAFCSKIDAYISTVKKGEGGGTNTEKINKLVSRLPRFLIKFVVWGIKFLDYHNALPKSLINGLPFFGSVFFTNVGSVGIDAPLHHNYEIGNCGIFCAIGKIRKENILKPDGTSELRDKVKVTFTYDDRITDGIYCARAIDMLREMTENPEQLETPLELSTEQLVKLGLTEKELNNV